MEEILKHIRPELVTPATMAVYVIQIVKKAWGVKSMSIWVGRVLLLVNLLLGLGIAFLGRAKDIVEPTLMGAWYSQGVLLGVWMLLFYHATKWVFARDGWSLKKPNDSGSVAGDPSTA